jgi:hypothetical protein
MNIPKIIHLVWLGDGEYPENIKRCLNSWKEVLPDFEVMTWDTEKALQVDCDYVKEAIACKKWAFASDVIRLYALYNVGGVYMDTDMFVTRRFDEFMNGSVNLFNEYHNKLLVKGDIDKDGKRVDSVNAVNGCGIQAAFMISEPHNPYIKMIMDYYKDKHFALGSNGKIKKDELISPAIYAIQLEKCGYKYMDKKQDLENGLIIYPSKYVAGSSGEVTSESFAIHQCEHSWFDYTPIQKLKIKIKKILKKIIKK